MRTTNECRVELIDSMGTDLTIVNAARVSFDKESDWLSESECPTDPVTGGKIRPYNRLNERDQKLISYLARHNHWTPFSHVQITLREEVPIFVARQRFKHMVGFAYNEVSRRYVDDEPEFFIPDEWRARPDGSVKQGSGIATLEVDLPMWEGHVEDEANAHQEYYVTYLGAAVETYNDLLENGVAPEQARMVLPQNMMTSYYVTGSLAAWARAYKQRIDPHAQKEIQDLAKKWGEIIAPICPVSWEALTKE